MIIARLAAQNRQVERTHVWTRWELIRFCLPRFVIGLGIGALIDIGLRLTVG